MTTINFGSENLKVDFLSFNTKFNDDERIQRMANYLSDTYQCNSKFEDKNNPKRNCTLVEKDNNRCKVLFTANQVKYWSGISLDFAGNNAKYFYNAIKSRKLDWDKMDFDYTNLGRIDLCYDRRLEKNDPDIDLFMEKCKDQINAKPRKPNAEIERNVLRVGSRKSSNFFRIYKKENGREIRFELEMKKTVAKKFQHYLFSHQLEKFEEMLSKHFYKQAVKTFSVKSSYTDWLIDNFRRVKKTPIIADLLAATYLTDKPIDDLKKEKYLYKLLQLLSYIRNLESLIEPIGDQIYRTVSFPVNDFLEVTGKDKNNSYQIRKLVHFLESLQNLNPMLKYFSDDVFRSAAIFPSLKIERKKCWTVKLSIAEELYLYTYPFNLPKTFLIYQDTYDLRVKLFFIKSFAVRDIEKQLRTESFLVQFSVSNYKSSKIRKYIVALMHHVLNSKLIEPEFTILTKANKIKTVSKLTSGLVSNAKSILYNDNINQD